MSMSSSRWKKNRPLSSDDMVHVDGGRTIFNKYNG
jgi:hypothetical protein